MGHGRSRSRPGRRRRGTHRLRWTAAANVGGAVPCVHGRPGVRKREADGRCRDIPIYKVGLRGTRCRVAAGADVPDMEGLVGLEPPSRRRVSGLKLQTAYFFSVSAGYRYDCGPGRRTPRPVVRPIPGFEEGRPRPPGSSRATLLPWAGSATPVGGMRPGSIAAATNSTPTRSSGKPMSNGGGCTLNGASGISLRSRMLDASMRRAAGSGGSTPIQYQSTRTCLTGTEGAPGLRGRGTRRAGPQAARPRAGKRVPVRRVRLSGTRVRRARRRWNSRRPSTENQGSLRGPAAVDARCTKE